MHASTSYQREVGMLSIIVVIEGSNMSHNLYTLDPGLSTP